MAKKAKCPWSRESVRVAVSDSIDGVGGPAVFRFVGPNVRHAIINGACWHQVSTAVSCGGEQAQAMLDFATMRAIEVEFMRVAGIAKENGIDQGQVKAEAW